MSAPAALAHDRPARALTPLVVASMLALLLGLQPITTDLYLPALPLLARELAASPGATQQTMSVLILTFGLMQLIWGPLADRYGRRPVLLASLALLAAAGIGAALATHIAQLIAWRGAQGAALAAAVVCARAMVRDLYEPHEGARIMALGLSGLGVLAIAAPLAGGVLTAWLGWRSTLAAVAASAAVAGLFVWRVLPETLPQRNPRALQFDELWRNASRVLAHPTFRAWTLLVSATYGGLFILLSASSFAYIRVLGFTPAQYGVALATGSLSYVLGTLVCRRWLVRHGLAGAVRRGALFTLAGSLGMMACALLPHPTWPMLLAAQCCYTFGHGQHQPCGQAGAVGPFPQAAGVASALAGCVLALVAFATGVLLGASMDGTLRPMTLGIAIWGLVTTTIAWTLVQRHGHAPRTT
jgi:DHA1 family bicyclomycin/chloramphenicol resistance-like MFS transporter